jgi:hypothetical protein
MSRDCREECLIFPRTDNRKPKTPIAIDASNALNANQFAGRSPTAFVRYPEAIAGVEPAIAWITPVSMPTGPKVLLEHNRCAGRNLVLLGDETVMDRGAMLLMRRCQLAATARVRDFMVRVGAFDHFNDPAENRHRCSLRAISLRVLPSPRERFCEQ